MRHRLSVMTFLAAGLLAMPALAQPPGEAGEGGDQPRRPARERILRAFDKDGDGRLNDEEREAMRQQVGDRFEELRGQMRELFEERRPDSARQRQGRRPDAGRDGQRRPRGEADRQRARRRGPGQPRGPIGPMGGPRERNLETLFAWFDIDGDNMLNRREFAELSQFVERRRPGPPGGPAGPRLGRRGPDGQAGRGGDRNVEGRGPGRRFEGPPRGEGPGARERDRQRPRREGPPRQSRPVNAADSPPTTDRADAAAAI